MVNQLYSCTPVIDLEIEGAWLANLLNNAMAEKQLETAVDTNTTTSHLTSNRAAAATDDEYDSDTAVIDPANEHRDDPANKLTRADGGSKSKGRRTPKKKHSSSKKGTGTNADLNYRHPGTENGGSDEDRHRETIMLQ